MNVMDPSSPLEELRAPDLYLCIAVEGRETRDGRLLEPGAVEWEFGTRLPLRALPEGSPPEHGHRGASVVGFLQTDRVSQPEGLVMAHVYIEPEKMPDAPFALGIDLDQLGFFQRDGVMTVTHARLRAVTILPKGQGVWPEVMYERI